MNKKKIFELAEKERLDIKLIKHDDYFRHDIVRNLTNQENIGIELGVAKGIFSKRMLQSLKFRKFYAVDSYVGTYSDHDYIKTLKFLEFQNSNFCLIRSDFDSALNLFQDEYFDFIYIDGYAHTGEEGGKTIIDWFAKLKPGGILSGDDYHDDWPLVVWAVNNVVKQLDVDLHVTGKIENENYSKYPSWFIIKPLNFKKLSLDKKLYALAMSEKERIHNLRTGFIGKLRKFLSKYLKTINIIK